MLGSRWWVLCFIAAVLDAPASAQEHAAVATWEAGSPSLERRPICERVRFDVALEPESMTRYQVVGSLCALGKVEGGTLQILLAGATYTKEYWDFPYQWPDYSYVAAQTAAGFATLSLDRIGTGESDRPPADRVTVRSNAFVVHQVVQSLRAGTRRSRLFGRLRPSRVVLVGHSLGSAVAAVEAATYQDVDGAIFSGVLHNEGPRAYELAQHLQPASQDPAFSGSDVPDGYLTTTPGQRGPLFYLAETADPRLIEGDEMTKSTVTIGELTDVPEAALASASVRVPVLVVVGDEDLMFCDAPSCSQSGALERERRFFAPEACVTLLALPRAGHVLNLHRHAGLWYGAAAAWTAWRVGTGRRRPKTAPCL